jgi:hypothetical protein
MQTQQRIGAAAGDDVVVDPKVLHDLQGSGLNPFGPRT